MSKKMEIYVVSHSEKDIINIKSNEIYIPLFVGRAGKDNLGFCSDDSGINISGKNDIYCELTGLYWMWKNINPDILGLVHYRRFFAKWKYGKRLEKKDFEKIFEDYDIILPKKKKVIFDNIYLDYNHWHYAKDLDICREVIGDVCPEYLDSFDKIIFNRNAVHAFNMFVAPKNIIDDYCDWLFPIFEEFDKRVNIDEYVDYQKRINGFISECIFDVWLDKQNLKIKELPVRVLGLKFNLSLLIFTSRWVTKPYKFYVKYINKNAKRRYDDK